MHIESNDEVEAGNVYPPGVQMRDGAPPTMASISSLRGTVNLTNPARFSPRRQSKRAGSAGTGHRFPLAERASAEQAVVDRAQEMSADAEEIQHEPLH